MATVGNSDVGANVPISISDPCCKCMNTLVFSFYMQLSEDYSVVGMLKRMLNCQDIFRHWWMAATPGKQVQERKRTKIPKKKKKQRKKRRKTYFGSAPDPVFLGWFAWSVYDEFPCAWVIGGYRFNSSNLHTKNRRFYRRSRLKEEMAQRMHWKVFKHTLLPWPSSVMAKQPITEKFSVSFNHFSWWYFVPKNRMAKPLRNLSLH